MSMSLPPSRNPSLAGKEGRHNCRNKINYRELFIRPLSGLGPNDGLQAVAGEVDRDNREQVTGIDRCWPPPKISLLTQFLSFNNVLV